MGNVSKEELRKMMATLRRKGLSDTDLRYLKKMASGHMDKNTGFSGTKSMSKEETEHLLKDLKEHPSWHHLSKGQIGKVEEELKEDLND